MNAVLKFSFVSSAATPSPDLYRNASQPQATQNVASNAGNVPMGRPNAPFVDQINTSNLNARYFWPTSTAFINVNDVHTNQQFAYMQQVYAQYMSQYMQM